MDKIITQQNWNIDDEEEEDQNNNTTYDISQSSLNPPSSLSAIYSNIMACLSIGDIMTSLLGPMSRDKLLVNQYGEIIITNDGITLLNSINIEHPACRMMVELSKSMDDQNGDGTTTVVILASLLLRKALKLFEAKYYNPSQTISIGGTTKKISPMRIIKGFMMASKIAVDTINRLAISFDLNSDDEDNTARKLMIETANTTLNSKLLSHFYPKLAELAVDSIMMARKAYGKMVPLTPSMIKVICIEGSPVTDSFVTNDRVYKVKLLNRLHQTTNIKIAILTFSIISDSKSSLKNEEDFNLRSMVDQQTSQIKSMVVGLKRLGVTLVFIQDQTSAGIISISNLSLSYFEKAKITVVSPLPKDMIDGMCEELNIKSFSDVKELKSKNTFKQLVQFSSCQYDDNIHQGGGVGLLFLKQRQIIKDDTNQGHQQEQSLFFELPTILLKGTSRIELEETERALHDAICVLCNLTRRSMVVPGGGACEIASSVDIINSIQQDHYNNDLERASMLAFSESMEEIVLVLCKNAGVDGLPLVESLKIYHNQEQLQSNPSSPCYMGVNLIRSNNLGTDSSFICDMVKEGVLETLSNKLAQITMATEIVISILKIDQVIYRTNN